MAKLKAGDRVDFRVKDSEIISPYSEYHEIITLEIIAVDNYGYYCFVPQYITLKKTSKIDQYKMKELNIDKKYIGDEYIYVAESTVFKVKYIMSGHKCKKCQDYYDMVAANQEDGSFICWRCRNSY